MSEFVEFLAGAEEPLTVGEIKQNSRIDLDLTDDDDFLTQIIIPAARQQAESRTGACLKPARYSQRLPGFPKSGSIALDHALVSAVESITHLPATGARVTLDPAQYEVVIGARESVIAPTSGAWPSTGISPAAVHITYSAGLSAAALKARFPSARHWLLMAASWAYDNRLLFVPGKLGFQELPEGYYSALLAPITVLPKV